MFRATTQRGFALLAFVLALAVVAFSFVLGYSVNLTREQAAALPEAQRAYLADVRAQLLVLYRERARTASQTTSQWRAVAADENVLATVNAPLRWGAQATISEPLPDEQGAPYQRIVVWLPTDTDAENPPDLETFRATGQWRSCAEPAPCAERPFVIVDGQALQRELRAQAQERLMRAAYKLQAYFKARVLQDPERPMNVNYFRNPRGGACPAAPVAPDFGCINEYRALAAGDPVAVHANLLAEDLVSPWGEPVEVSNLLDSESARAPFSMALRVPVKGTERYLRVLALQPF